MFTHLPTPDVLNWLAKGRLADRKLRAVRLWVILTLLYGESGQASVLPQPFRYANVRDRLFSPTHGNSETANCQTLSAYCSEQCLCQQTVTTLLANRLDASPLLTTSWQNRFIALTALSPDQVTTFLRSHPFFTVHRSIRDDLSHLVDMGWLTNKGQGRFHLVNAQHWPTLPESQSAAIKGLSIEQTWEVLRSLESIAFVRPNLEVIIQTLWEQLNHSSKAPKGPSHPGSNPSVANSSVANQTGHEPEKRIFLHLNYILSDTQQEHVDTLQEQIEQLWRQGGGVIQFDYAHRTDKKTGHRADNRADDSQTMTVYPVCLHYMRRAKYLSAYGKDPLGTFGWHNYRLDRITSERLTILHWENTNVPTDLRALHQSNQLPTAAAVSTALENAWGFNFYLPRRLLIMRFPPAFAQRYVHQTERHTTFEPIDYKALPTLIKQEIKDAAERTALLKTLSQQKASDRYYRAWIRLGDINILMRLRDWRPNGEVIAPLELRQQMQDEAKAELKHYKKLKK